MQSPGRIHTLTADTKLPIISVAIPITNRFKNNEPVGVLSMDISLDVLAKNTNSIVIGKKGT